MKQGDLTVRDPIETRNRLVQKAKLIQFGNKTKEPLDANITCQERHAFYGEFQLTSSDLYILGPGVPLLLVFLLSHNPLLYPEGHFSLWTFLADEFCASTHRPSPLNDGG
jgi:hypothetical protein